MLKFYSTTAVLLNAVSCTIAAATPNIIQRTAADVLAAVVDISNAITNLDTIVTAYPLTGGTLSNALNLHNAAVALNNLIIAATAIVIKNGPLSSPDADNILAILLAIEPIIHHLLSEIVHKRPAFVALPIGGLPALIRNDLINLRASTSDFLDALIDAFPAPLKPDLIAYKARILASFDAAIASYP